MPIGFLQVPGAQLARRAQPEKPLVAIRDNNAHPPLHSCSWIARQATSWSTSSVLYTAYHCLSPMVSLFLSAMMSPFLSALVSLLLMV